MKKIYLILLLFTVSCLMDGYLVVDCKKPNYVILKKHRYEKKEIDELCKNKDTIAIGVPNYNKKMIN